MDLGSFLQLLIVCQDIKMDAEVSCALVGGLGSPAQKEFVNQKELGKG